MSLGGRTPRSLWEYDYHFSLLHRRQQSQNFGHERPGVSQTVGGCFERDHGEAILGEILLPGKVLIHRDQQVELILSPFQQSAVFDASPAKERHRFDHVTGQVSPEPPVEVFV